VGRLRSIDSRAHTAALIAAIAAASVAASCATSDLGAPCHLLRADGTELAPRPGHDLLQSGSGECEQFACASFAGAPAVCTRPCDRAGDGCENGFKCRELVLDAAALDALRAATEGRDDDRDGADDFDQLAAGLHESAYCAPAR
jgi:hypothetical protein